MNYPDFLVYIDCITYNHASYIEDAMNGFCMQETTFPFVAAIIDDASTDGEQNVIKRYLEENFDFSEKAVARKWETDDAYFIYAQHKTNKNCYFAVVLLKYNFYQLKKDKTPLISEWRNIAKYVAFCEGDDYWTKKEKLQTQVDFLEQNLNYSMCFHKANKLYEIECNNFIKCEEIENRDYSGKELLEDWTVPTASIVCRTEIFTYKTKGDNRILNGDIIIVLKCSEFGKLRGLSDFMSVYRINENSITNNVKIQKDRYLKFPEHYEFIFDNFHSIKSKKIKRIMGEIFLERAKNKTFYTKSWYYDMMKSLKYTPTITAKYLIVMSWNHIKRKIGF